MKAVLEMRCLLNFELDSFSPLALILVGQDELWSALRLRSYEPVFQCLNTSYRLPGLNLIQTKEYIAHQLALSGLGQVFPDDAIAKVFSLSRGLPRLINKICSHCLIDLKSHALELVDSNVLERVVCDLQL